MSFGFSVSDTVATSQLCFTVLKALNAVYSSETRDRLMVELRGLQSSLSILPESLKPDEVNHVLSQERFQEPLRNALSKIRRDLLALENLLSRRRFLLLHRVLAEQKLELHVETISGDRQILHSLLDAASLARDREILSSLRTWTIKSDKSSVEETINIQNWLAGTHQVEKHLRLTEKHGESLGDWILTESKYREWLDSPGSFFWLSGIPGSGKSVLCARVIETLRNDHSRLNIAFVYFDSTSAEGSSLERGLMALIAQLTQEGSKYVEIIRPLYYKYSDGSSLPSVSLLKGTLLSILFELTDSYIILDGIDECSNVEEALDLVAFLHSQGLQSLHTFVTSRRIREIEATSLGTRFGRHAIYTEIDSRKDIERFIMHELQTRTYSRKFSMELKAYILDVLPKSSDGMFLYARLALDRLSRAKTSKQAKALLHELPVDLATLYKNMLQDVPNDERPMVRRVLIWLANSARPLTVEEMADAIALNPDGHRVNPEDQLIDPDEIIWTCSNFLQVVQSPDSRDSSQKVIKAIHMSFIEFLKSEHLINQSSRFQWSDGDRILAECCISYLLHVNQESSTPSENLADSPIFTYAAEFWPYHARRAQNTGSWHPKTTQLIKRLFRRTASFKWLTVFETTSAVTSDRLMPARQPGSSSSPEYYASSLGLRHVLESYLEESDKETSYSTPISELEAGLYAASYNGYVDIVKLLLEHGVHPDAAHCSDGRPLDASILNNQIAVVKLLLDHDADITYKDGIAGAPFKTAVSNGDAELVDLVLHTLKRKVSSDYLLESLSHGLLDSARNGNLELVQLVFNADDNLDIDTVDEAGWTALHWAIKNQHNNVQQHLIDLGADIDRKNLAGDTPADFAWSKRRLDLSAYTKVIDLKKKANQAFSCHVLQQLSNSGESQTSVFCKKFKFSHKNRVAKSNARKAIIREHTILQRINHPFIVSYLWYEENHDQGTAQLYLEYCNGGDLDPYSARARSIGEEDSSSDENDKQATSGPVLEPKDLWRYMFQIACALAYLHHGLLLRQEQVFSFEKQWNQILHRDIKPSNIVLNVPEDGETQAKLCDLGLAKGLRPKLKEAKETGGIGTRNYWPPEMFRKDGFWTAKGDIFSYGSTFDDLWTKTSKEDQDCHEAKDILGKCMSDIPSNRPSSIQLLEMTRKYVVDGLPQCAANIQSCLGRSNAGYLYDSLYLLAEQIDTKESYESRSVRLRRDILISRLKNLCDDGAGALFDAQPGPPSMKLHIAVLLNRKAAFERAIEVPQAINSSWKDSGWTALHIAAQEMNIEMYDQLLKAGAVSSYHDGSDNIPEFYLQRSGQGAE